MDIRGALAFDLESAVLHVTGRSRLAGVVALAGRAVEAGTWPWRKRTELVTLQFTSTRRLSDSDIANPNQASE